MRTSWVAMATGVVLAVVVSRVGVGSLTTAASADELVNQSDGFGRGIHSWANRPWWQRWRDELFPPPVPDRLTGGIL